MKTYEVMVGYYPVGALLVLPSGVLRVTQGPPEGTVNHETEPMLSRLTVPVWDMCLLLVAWRTGTSLLCQPFPDWRESVHPWTPLLSPLHFPSVHLGGRRQTSGFEGKMDGGSKRRAGDRASRRAGEEWGRDVWRPTSAQTEWQMKGLWSTATFHTDQS